jgi:polar amino acid transport system permease protein
VTTPASEGSDAPGRLLATPDATRRRALPAFRGNLGPAAGFLLAALGVLAFTWWALWTYTTSVEVGGAGRTTVRGIAGLLAVLALAVPLYGALGLARALRARSAAARGDLPRARILAEDARDAMWFVVGLGLTALAVAFLAYLLSANGGALRRVMFDWDYMWRGRTALWRGFLLNVKIFVVAQVLVLVWALIVAVVRMLPGRACAPVRWLAIVYTDLFRGIPAIIVIYLIVLGFGLAGVPIFDAMSKDDQIFWLVVLALTLVYGAYVAEVYRAGLESIHWSQTAAARSLGLSQWQTMRYVVIPQAVRRVLPPLLNDAVALQKDTALASIVGVVEVLGTAQLLKNRYFNLSPVTASALFFLAITIPFTRLVDHLIARDRRRTQGGS